jgi:hypothetical protein
MGGEVMTIVVEANPEFASAFFELGGYEGEFDEEGVVEILTDCSCGTQTTTCLTVDQLQELVDEAKKFQARRAAHLAGTKSRSKEDEY